MQTTASIRFQNGASYERYMGKWSQLVGQRFLDWLAAPAQLQWLDVGCGNGAFTEMLINQCQPASVHGIDPSEPQLAYARQRPALAHVVLEQADAMALPYPDDRFDAAVMPLVIFFVPKPEQGVAEMKRVVRPGGTVSAYAWDMVGGGFPYEILLSEIRALGITIPEPSSPDASRMEVMQRLWSEAGLQDVQARAITVYRVFDDFEDFWSTALGAPSVGQTLAALSDADRTLVRERVFARLPADADGRITYSARANAIKGRVAP
ncbi:methyltransferase domain-containing protein [Lampropedia puyangensis]|uniref:Methyltransferase domain-containing protein n=1 Tax=Lampropedia puyangensis TaxID=1330072 RepID=A0A4S8EXW2_9BURK|nr:class I SAM-dependent methyltransferase [Lampropedia puyangensis]THT99378.1 methyltransferase domain-containing protein [Lampropedia puyangensis]